MSPLTIQAIKGIKGFPQDFKGDKIWSIIDPVSRILHRNGSNVYLNAC